MHNGLVFEVYGIFVHKKTAPFGLDGGCPTFGVQFKVQTALSFFTIKIQKNKPEKTRACLGHIPYMQATLAMTYILHTGYACYTYANYSFTSITILYNGFGFSSTHPKISIAFFESLRIICHSSPSNCSLSNQICSNSTPQLLTIYACSSFNASVCWSDRNPYWITGSKSTKTAASYSEKS